MVFLFIDLMTDTFNGFPIWYWWGGVTTFAVFYGNHLDVVKKHKEKGEDPDGFEWGAALGISMFWFAIPIFSALWLAYKLFQLVTKQ